MKGDIFIGNDVWFGYDALIMGGVKIGDGAIIATRAVVVKDVPPYAIVAGNPVKDDKTIERLLRISWWDWDIKKINCHPSLICNLDVDRLELANT